MFEMDELLNTAPCGFLSFTDDGTIVMANTTLQNLLGYEAHELQDKRVESILPIASRIFYQTHFFPLLKLNNKVEEVYFTLRTKSGTDIPVLTNAVRREREGVVINDCIFMHMRQRNQYEDEILHAKKEAEDATRAKDEFLAVVSHELRTPLNAILGWARIANVRNSDSEIVCEALEVIERNAKSQAQLIEDLLDFARITSGKLRLNVQKA